jgi:ornithine carbamoyltransferase
MSAAAATRVSMPRDLLTVADLDSAQLEGLLDLAEEMRATPGGWLSRHPGELVACYFAKPSTRTRVSFEGACFRLGMLGVMLRPDELQLGRGEPIADTARVLSGYAAAIVVRTFAQAEIEEMARAASVPVINALTDEHHPCQALADLLTLRDRFGSLRGLRLAYVGDGNNVATSLMQAGALAGMHVVVATPGGFGPDAAVCARMHDLALARGGSVRVTYEPVAAVAEAQAVYTDVWVSMGQEERSESRRQALAAFRVDAELMSRAADDAVFMHCLPAHRGEEVSAEVIDGPRSVVFEQARNRLPTEQAVLHALLARGAGEER